MLITKSMLIHKHTVSAMLNRVDLPLFPNERGLSKQAGCKAWHKFDKRTTEKAAERDEGADLKYLVTSLCPSRAGVLPTACLTIQLPSCTRGTTLKAALLRFSLAPGSPVSSNMRMTETSNGL